MSCKTRRHGGRLSPGIVDSLYPSCSAMSNALRKLAGDFLRGCARCKPVKAASSPCHDPRTGNLTMDAPNPNKTASLTIGNKNYDFPIRNGSTGPDVIDISTLYTKAGVFTYDPGFMATASCESKITYIDGDIGILRYRGYPIEQVADGDFLETCYLLLEGELPTKMQKADFVNRVTNHTMVHEQMA